MTTTNNLHPNPKSKEEKIASMIRVDHAGEYGAVRIYQGQLDALKNSACEDTIKHMQDQEKVHLETFEKMIVKRRVRPTVLTPVWHLAGYAMGYISGKLGEKAAMACTVAVEEVIDEHYADQEQQLQAMDDETELAEIVHKFRQEELEHRDIGLKHGAEETPNYKALTTIVKTASRTAIWLSKRI